MFQIQRLKLACSSRQLIRFTALSLLFPAVALATPNETQRGGLLSHDSAPTEITILHTNDLHSHFRPDRTALRRGGFARLKTKITELRAKYSHTLLVDGGDFSEGTAYYTLGAGRATLEMMDHLGYDAAVVGNHDFLNGPDILLKSLEESTPAVELLANNIDMSNYPRADSLQQWIKPYTIKNIDGKKVALIGLTTFELIYDTYFKPVNIFEPFFSTASLATKLKKEAHVDAVIAISHNSIKANEWVLKIAHDIDFIIGAHDHVKLTKPVVVERPGANPGYIVETGEWGQYLGELKFVIEDHKVSFKDYRLWQMDFRTKEDPETLARIDSYEKELETLFGPEFFEVLGYNNLEINRTGKENLIGNLVTDSYISTGGVDFALEPDAAIYGELYPGPVTRMDAFNVFPQIYNPITQKAWTLKKIPFSGFQLHAILNILFAANPISDSVSLSASGISFEYDPLFLAQGLNQETQQLQFFTTPYQSLTQKLQQPAGIPVVKNLKIQGEPVSYFKTYWLGTGGILLQAFKTINSVIEIVPLDEMQDSQIEIWDHVARHIQKLGRLDETTLRTGDRIQSASSDLGIYPSTIQWNLLQSRSEDDTVHGKIRVEIKNYGNESSQGSGENQAVLQFFVNEDGIDTSRSRLIDTGVKVPLKEVAPGESITVETEISLPHSFGFAPVEIQLSEPGSTGRANKSLTRWFESN